MNAGLFSALYVARMSFRAIQFAAAAGPRVPGWPAAVVFAAILAAWLVNSREWGFGDAQTLVAVCAGSLVATAALTAGWVAEPEELEQWVLRALAATVISVIPVVR
jgi:hypothetical protein